MRDTARQSLAYGVFWILLAVSTVATLVCLTASVDGAPTIPNQAPEFLPAGGLPGYLGYGSEQVLSWRYYGLSWGAGSRDPDGLDSSAGPGSESVRRAAKYDSVPLGEVQIRHGDHVHATDGEIGRVEGLVIDPDNHQVTHVLLQDGHLWGHKEVAIPIGAVTDAEIGIRLNLSKEQVENLPAVDIDHPDR